MKKYLGAYTLLGMLLALLITTPAWADRQANAEHVVTTVLFDFEADEFVSYGVRRNGFVDLTFARNTPDEIYTQIIDTIRAHPDVRGVLAGKSGPSCRRF